jgi:curli production assembly/transport component CsgF
MKKRVLIILFFVFTAGAVSYGQQLVYTPKNPAFGGDPFTGNWLLSTANAQNPFDDDQQDGLAGLEDLTALDQTLNNQLLNNALGENGLQGLGTSSNGNFEIEAFETLDGLIVNILDVLTGEQTQIVIPNN